MCLIIISSLLSFLFSTALLAATPNDSTRSGNDSIQHSLTGFESYFENEFIQKSLLERLPLRNIDQLKLLQAGNYYVDRDAYFAFGIGYGDEILLDGMRVKNSSAFPFRSIGRFAVLNNQSSIQLGNSAAGFLLIEAPEGADSLSAQAEFLTTAPFNSLGNYVLDFNLSTPFKFKKESHIEKELLPSIFVSVQLSRTNDLYPSYAKHYVLNDAAQSELNSSPLTPSLTSDAFIVTAETLTDSVFEQRDFADAPQKAAGSFVKLNLPITKKISLTAGTYFQFDKREDYVQRYELFNSANYQQSTMRNFDNYLRAEHTLRGKNGMKIHQQFQFNLSNYYVNAQSATHGDNLFNYGYLGSFEIFNQPVFSYGADAVTGNTGWRLSGYQDTLVTYAPGTVNLIMSNYTSSYYELAGATFENGRWTTPQSGAQEGFYESLAQIEAVGSASTLNGNRPRIAHDIWYNAGRVSNNYGKGYTRDIGGNYLFALTLKQKHHIKIGAEITKTKQAYYKMAPVSLWELMRQLTNKHIDQLDTDNPYLLIDGTIYQYNDPNAPAFGQNDTILYERKYVASQQSYFDKSLRKKLGLEGNSTSVLNTDALTPDFYSLEMFSPDELLNNGNPYWDAMGYDQLGNKISGSDYADFFYKKDANGNYMRPQQAYEPNYFAAYSEYQFYSKWLDVRAGLRVDRFDANQPVLRDEYSLYKIKTAGEVNSLNGNPVNHPANIANDAAVYVDDNYNPTEILGYRSGDYWFSADGSEIDPRFIARESSTGRITPYLENADENIQAPDFDFHGSFKDYEPVVNPLPHIQLEGKPFKQTRLYARYFAVAENPDYYNWFRAGDYYFFNENINTTIFNPAMKPMRVDRFIAGIRQKIYRQLSADFSYYRSRIVNALGIETITYAFPRDYTIYTNLPKETRQGLVASLLYQSEKSAGFNVVAHYNWQPDGYVEHVFNGYAQFNFGYGIDYIGWKTKKGRMPLEGLGLSLFCNLRQGMRYTKQQNATAEALLSQSTRRIPTGTLNGEQLPVFYNLDFKVEKGFTFSSGKMHLSVYLWIQNLLNKRNILNIYPYTGKPDDDGYLTSPSGQQDVSGRANAESFSDQYAIKLKDPANVDAPRIIRWGMVISFR